MDCPPTEYWLVFSPPQYKLFLNTNGCFMTKEEQFRQAISRLDIPKVQLEAICDLHSTVYEAIDWKGMYDKLPHLKNNPRVKDALKLGAGALVGVGPIVGVYNIIDKLTDGDDKSIEQIMDERADINKKLYPDLPTRTELENDAYTYNPKHGNNAGKRGGKSTKVQEPSATISVNKGGAGGEKIMDNTPKPDNNAVKQDNKSTKVQEPSATISLDQDGTGGEKIRDNNPQPDNNAVKQDDDSTTVQEPIKLVPLNQDGAGWEKIRTKFDMIFPDVSDISSPDSALRKFVEVNLSSNFTSRTTPEQQSDHIDRVLRAVKNTAKVTADRGIGEAELIALIGVESHFDDKPNTTSYKGIAQLGDDAMDDARDHAGEFGLGSAPMGKAEIVEDAINMAASYLLYIMYNSARSNKVNMVNGEEDDDKEHGDIRFVFACYNAGIGDVNDPFLHEKSSVTKLYRRVLRGELTPDQAVGIKGSMKEALTYPTKIFKVLDYLKSIGIHTNFSSTDYIYSKTKR